MTKTYVIDTNVILEDPNIVRGLKGEILIPTTVLQELDNKKYGDSEKNRNSREFARIIDKNQVIMNFPISHESEESCDDQIINVARNERKNGKDVILITNDIYMSILAKAYGIATVKSVKKEYVSDESYTGFEEDHDIDFLDGVE